MERHAQEHDQYHSNPGLKGQGSRVKGPRVFEPWNLNLVPCNSWLLLPRGQQLQQALDGCIGIGMSFAPFARAGSRDVEDGDAVALDECGEPASRLGRRSRPGLDQLV